MDWKEDLGDTSIDEVFNFNGSTKGEKKKKRSSILKQSKYANIDFCDNEETVTDHNRRSLRMKRVSFAETFQVKEMHTGNIYDIPGFNESNASRTGPPSEPNKDCTGGNLKSRSSIPESSVLQTEKPMNLNPLMNEEEFIFEPQYASYSILDKSSVGTELQDEIPSQSSIRKDFLEDDNMEMTMEQGKEEMTRLEEKNACPLNVDDLFGDSPLKSGLQEYEHKGSLSPLSIAYAGMETAQKDMCLASSNGLEFNKSAVPLFEEMSGHPQFNLNASNKENIFQISPKFQNLKFIDSPPKWANVPEDVLNSLNMMDFTVPRSISNVKPLKNTNEGKENIKSQQKGLRPLTYENQKDVPLKVVTLTFKNPKVLRSAEGKSSERNKTPVSMDLTLMPEGCSEDSSVPEKDVGFEPPPAVNKYADLRSQVTEKTNNKTRFSICDMEMTCLADNQLEDSSLCLSPHKSQEKENIPTKFTDNIVLEKIRKNRFSTCNMDLTCLADKQRDDSSLDISVKISQFADTSTKILEKTNNKTRFSTCNMDLTCLADKQTDDSSLDMSVKISQFADTSTKILEKTNNKTRFSTCNMDLTCLADKQTDDSSLDMSAKISQFVDTSTKVLEKTNNKTKFSTCNMDLTCLADKQTDDSSLDMSVKIPEFADTSTKVLEKTNNKTRFSTCNMDLTCLADKQTDDSSLDMSAKIPEFADTSTKFLEKTNNKTRFSTCNMDLTGDPKNESSMPSSPENRDCNEKMIAKNSYIFDPDMFHIVGKSILAENEPSGNNINLTEDCIKNINNKTSLGNVDLNKSPIIYNDAHFTKIGDKSDIIEDRDLNHVKYSTDICDSSTGQKYLKILTLPHKNNRILVNNAFDKENFSKSFELKNKENMYSNRKRSLHSNDKPVKLPLGEKLGALFVRNSYEPFSSDNCLSKSGVATIEQNEPRKSVGFLEGTSFPEASADSKMSNLHLSNSIDITHHDMCLDDSTGVALAFETALKYKDTKPEDFEAISVADSSVVSETSLQPKVISLREKFEKASFCEGMLWRVKFMSEEAAAFELRWKAYVFECTLRMEVENISASQCSVLFKPVGPKLGNTVRESVIDDIRDRAHDYFNYLVTDTVFPFPIYSDNLINKMAEYSAIAKRIQSLMLDLLKCSITGTNEVSYELDSLTLYVQICNEYFECVYDVTFPIDLKTYPNEKIVPDVKHMYCKDITEKVRAALREVEPGKDYLYRMIDVAREVKN